MLNYAEILGDIVKKARLELKLTQSAVADQVDVDVRTVMHIENHKGNPKMEVLFPLIRALKIDPSTIFYPEMEHNSSGVGRMNQLLSKCSDEEVEALLVVCETVLSAIRSTNAKTIEDK